MLQLYNSNKTGIFESIIAENKTMVLFCDPLSKKESMEWTELIETPSVRQHKSATIKSGERKISHHYLELLKNIADVKEKNKKLNEECYANLLYKLHSEIKVKRSIMLQCIHLSLLIKTEEKLSLKHLITSPLQSSFSSK